MGHRPPLRTEVLRSIPPSRIHPFVPQFCYNRVSTTSAKLVHPLDLLYCLLPRVQGRTIAGLLLRYVHPRSIQGIWVLSTEQTGKPTHLDEDPL